MFVTSPTLPRVLVSRQIRVDEGQEQPYSEDQRCTWPLDFPPKALKVSLVPRPFPLCARARNNWWVEKKHQLFRARARKGKGLGTRLLKVTQREKSHKEKSYPMRPVVAVD